MSNELSSFSVRELMADQNRYCVPMYQRNYAWEEGEIHQLIQDVQRVAHRTVLEHCRQTAICSSFKC